MPPLPSYRVLFEALSEDLHERRLGLRSKLGGTPDWEQTDETPTCPHCAKEMNFVGQLDSINHDDSQAGIQAVHADRLRLILAALNAAVAPSDMGLPGPKLHSLKGTRSGTWSVSVSGNWRVTFGFSGKDAVDVDYEDYH